MNKKVFALFLLLIIILPTIALGAQQNYIEGIITRLLSLLVWPLFVGLSIVMLIWAAILMLTAQGDEGKLTTARKAIIWAVIGIVVAILAYSAPKIIKRIIEPPQGQMPPAD